MNLTPVEGDRVFSSVQQMDKFSFSFDRRMMSLSLCMPFGLGWVTFDACAACDQCRQSLDYQAAVSKDPWSTPTR